MKKIKYYIITIVVILTYWDIISQHRFVPEIFLPAPTKVYQATAEMFLDANLARHVLISAKRILFGFILSFALAIPISLVISRLERPRYYLLPIISFFRYIPTSALVPLFILWFGIGETEKALIIFAAVFPFMVILIMDIIANVNVEYIEIAKTMGAKEKDIITKIIIPYSLPKIWDGARFMMGASWTILILAEIVGANSGIGYMIISKQRFVRTDAVIGLIAIIGAIGVVLDYLFECSRKALFPWSQKNYVSA